MNQIRTIKPSNIIKPIIIPPITEFFASDSCTERSGASTLIMVSGDLYKGARFTIRLF